MSIETISWRNNGIRIIDQTLLPEHLKYIYINNIRDLRRAIRFLKVRGAPALGAAGALGVYLGVHNYKTASYSALLEEMDKVARYLSTSRPTARNLFWGIERMKSVIRINKSKSVSKIMDALYQEALKIIQEDKESCRKIGYFGRRLIADGDNVMTICNAGILATIDYGTALGVIYSAKNEGKSLKVFACETRPLLQGVRLSAWELRKAGLNTTVICDNTAASLMQQGLVSKVIAGADRIAANGDCANKIGTLNLAILSKYHRIPFYIAAPVSTFDSSIKDGSGIIIEERDHREVKELLFKRRVAPAKTKVFNPAFDVTPHNLITAIITDRGIVKNPNAINIAKVIS